MKILIKSLAILGFLTTVSFADDGKLSKEKKLNDSSIYIAVGKGFSSGKVSRENTSGGDNYDLGKIKYKGNITLGYEYAVNSKFSLGVQIFAPFSQSSVNHADLPTLTLGKPNAGETVTYDESITDYNHSIQAGFITAGYKVLELGRFTTSIKGGVGLAVHAFEIETKTVVDIKSTKRMDECYDIYPCTELDQEDETRTALAYQIGISQAVKLTEKISMTLGLYYLNLGSPSFNIEAFKKNSSVKYDIKNKSYFNVALGLSYRF